MEFKQVIRERYSCKKYSPKHVPDEVLGRILEGGKAGPTAKIFRSTIYMYASHLGVLAKIDEATPCRYGATTVLAVAYDKENVYTLPRWRQGVGHRGCRHCRHASDAGCYRRGVDSCWINCFHARMLHELLGLPERGRKLLMLLDLGYAAEGSGPLPNHSLRKPLSETVTRI